MPNRIQEWLNEYQARRALSDSKQRQRQETLAVSSSGETSGASCPVVRFTLCRCRLLDVDAKYASVKDLLDGLQYAGLIHGDKEGQITLAVRQVKVKTKTEERTEIEIDTGPQPD